MTMLCHAVASNADFMIFFTSLFRMDKFELSFTRGDFFEKDHLISVFLSSIIALA